MTATIITTFCEWENWQPATGSSSIATYSISISLNDVPLTSDKRRRCPATDKIMAKAKTFKSKMTFWFKFIYSVLESRHVVPSPTTNQSTDRFDFNHWIEWHREHSVCAQVNGRDATRKTHKLKLHRMEWARRRLECGLRTNQWRIPDTVVAANVCNQWMANNKKKLQHNEEMKNQNKNLWNLIKMPCSTCTRCRCTVSLSRCLIRQRIAFQPNSARGTSKLSIGNFSVLHFCAMSSRVHIIYHLFVVRVHKLHHEFN